MTSSKDDLINNNEPRQYSVWSDLRAMRLLERVQKDMTALKASNARLRLLAIVSVVILSSSIVGLTGMLILTYSQLQQLKQQNTAPQSQNLLTRKSFSS